MGLSVGNVTAITDSIAYGINDFNTCFVTNTAASNPSNATIVTDVTATETRILALNDIVSELGLLTSVNTALNNVTAYVAGLQTISSFYAQYYDLCNALDKTSNYNGASGLNNFLTGHATQINGWFAACFNFWAAIAISVSPGRTPANIPAPIATANYFPYAAIDTMWAFTASGATTFSANAVGANANTAVSGGGVGQFYIYKSNATNAVGGATFTVSYTNAAGGTGSATYTTTSNVPTASGSLAAGYAISGAIGTAITGITGTGMTSGEAYTIGMKLVRAPAL